MLLKIILPKDNYLKIVTGIGWQLQLTYVIISIKSNLKT